MNPAEVERVRSFNRIVTERIGALNDHYLARERPLGASRVLWELDLAGVDLRQLRSRLGLDSGYLSRLLRLLEGQGLVAVERSGDDGRVRIARLREEGHAERTLLDRRSDELAWSLLEPLDEEQRARLVEAMGVVARLLVAGQVDVRIEDPASADARFCIRSYIAELDARFDAGFDPERSISAEAEELVEPHGLLLVARVRDEPVGCGALKLYGSEPVEIKRMWVAPETRGLGLGRRLLRELEQQARERGVTVARLETNRSLTEAIDLYRSAGYVEVAAFNEEPYADHWFEKSL
jgi:ribosomal protein S18 acetylase RimI-like enzyme